MSFPKIPPDKNFVWIRKFFELHDRLSDKNFRMTDVGYYKGLSGVDGFSDLANFFCGFRIS